MKATKKKSSIGTSKRLNQHLLGCDVCALCDYRTQVVAPQFTTGARVAFLGGAPGPKEDEYGVPFYGKDKEILDGIIKVCGLQEKDVYFGNIVRCRPPSDRRPTKDEINSCHFWSAMEFKFLKPSVIVLLGRSAADSIARTTASKSAPGTGYTTCLWPEGTTVVYMMDHPSWLLEDKEANGPTYKKQIVKLKSLIEFYLNLWGRNDLKADQTYGRKRSGQYPRI